MYNIPKKALERLSKGIARFQKILSTAKSRDVNESDTVSIINDILADVFGYDKYTEVTSELAIRGTYCDLAIKLNDKMHFLIECKAIGLELKEHYVKQAIDYGANKGIPWVILTNGIAWNIYKIKFEQPISSDLVFNFRFDEISAKNEKNLDLLYLLSKEGLEKNIREEYFEKIQCVNKYIIGNLLLNETVMNYIRKEIKRLIPAVKIDNNEIREVIEKDVIKREILDNDESNTAQEKIKKLYKKLDRISKKKDADSQDIKEKEVTLEVNSIQETIPKTEL